MAPITDRRCRLCASKLPASVADLKQIARASPPFHKGARGESTKRRGQRASSNQLLALTSLQPWPQLGPNARSKSLQPSAPRRPLQAEQLRARRPLAKPKRARPPQSSAVKLWAQASAVATFTRQTLLRLNLLQLQRSASASE